MQQKVRKKKRAVLMFIFSTVSQISRIIKEHILGIRRDRLKAYLFLIVLRMDSLDTLFLYSVGQ